MPATLGRGCFRYCSSTKASCCRMNSDLDKPCSPAARVRRAFISGSRAMVVAFLRVSAMEVMLPGEKLNHKAINQSSRSGMRCQPGRVNPGAFRERKGHPRAPDPFRVKNFSRFQRLAVPRAGLEPAQSDRKPKAGQVVAVYRLAFVEFEFRLSPFCTVRFRPKPRCHGTCMAQNAGMSFLGFSSRRGQGRNTRARTQSRIEQLAGRSTVGSSFG